MLGLACYCRIPARPNPTRLHNCYLGGEDNYVVDPETATEVLRAAPDLRAIAQENRALLQRALRFLVGEAGIRQIIDIGTGMLLQAMCTTLPSR
jgi:hypothetical protein